MEKNILMKNKLVIGLVIVVVALVVALLFVSGILKLPSFKTIVYSSQREVSEAVSEMSGDIDKVGSTLEEIDQALG